MEYKGEADMRNLPNILTLSRIALVVVMTVALALDGTVSPFAMR